MQSPHNKRGLNLLECIQRRAKKKNNPRDGTPLLCGQTERVETVQIGEEKALERAESGLSVSKEGDRCFSQ